MTSSASEQIPTSVVELPDAVVAATTTPPSAAGNHWLLLSVGALVAWGFWSFLPKMALQSMQPHSVIFYEALGNLLVAVPVLIYLRGRLKFNPRSVMLSALITALTVGAFLLYFFALKNGPVATVVTMTAMYPVVTMILARLVLKEKLNRLQLCAIALAIAAVYLLAG